MAIKSSAFPQFFQTLKVSAFFVFFLNANYNSNTSSVMSLRTAYEKKRFNKLTVVLDDLDQTNPYIWELKM